MNKQETIRVLQRQVQRQQRTIYNYRSAFEHMRPARNYPRSRRRASSDLLSWTVGALLNIGTRLVAWAINMVLVVLEQGIAEALLWIERSLMNFVRRPVGRFLLRRKKQKTTRRGMIGWPHIY